MDKTAIKEPLINDFSFCHNITNYWSMNKFHFHDNFEILFSLSNTTKFFIEDTMYNVERGDLFIINNKELHKTVAPDNVQYDRYVIMFNPHLFEKFCTKKTDLLKPFTHRYEGFSNKVHLSEDEISSFSSLLKKIEHYHLNEILGNDVYENIYFVELLLQIYNFYLDCEERKTLKEEKGDFKKVQQIIQYINGNLKENLSLDNLSKTFFLNKYYISHIFKNNTGFSINEYIINKRILQAKEFLKEDFTVSEVSQMVGFNNYCHFIRTFKNLVGVSPKQYSKEIKSME